MTIANQSVTFSYRKVRGGRIPCRKGKMGAEKFIPGDTETLRIFEVADDSLIGVHGWFLYVKAIQQVAPPEKVLELLPPDLLPHTHIWNIRYQPKVMVAQMEQLFMPYHIRRCLVAMSDIFSVALNEFVKRLKEVGKPARIRERERSYKWQLDWVFKKLENPMYPNESMQKRTPGLCNDVDNARVLRNVFVHRNGIISNDFLERDVLPCNTNPIDKDQLILKNLNKSVSLIPEGFVSFSQSHIELLHILHDQIQKKDFEQKMTYDYRLVGKQVDWRKILLGS